jgi:hypothetical protein
MVSGTLKHIESALTALDRLAYVCQLFRARYNQHNVAISFGSKTSATTLRATTLRATACVYMICL